MKLLESIPHDVRLNESELGRPRTERERFPRGLQKHRRENSPSQLRGSVEIYTDELCVKEERVELTLDPDPLDDSASSSNALPLAFVGTNDEKSGLISCEREERRRGEVIAVTILERNERSEGRRRREKLVAV